MDKAVGSKIADYLIKPVNPNQVLLSIKKNVHQQQLVTEQTTADYRSEFGRISSSLQMAETFRTGARSTASSPTGRSSFRNPPTRASRRCSPTRRPRRTRNSCKFVRRNYYNWINKRSDDTPVMSHTLMRTNIFPVADENPKTTLLLIDNFRYDQWRSISSLLRGYYDVALDDFYCAILPTATQYARNAVFAGLMPLAIDNLMPNKWLNDNEEGGKNQYEEEFLKRLMAQNGKNWKFSFDKLVRPEQGRRLVDNIQKVYDADFSVIITTSSTSSHARTETDIIREADRGRRGIPVADALVVRALRPLHHPQAPLGRGHTVVITSDHGTIRVMSRQRVTATDLGHPPTPRTPGDLTPIRCSPAGRTWSTCCPGSPAPLNRCPHVLRHQDRRTEALPESPGRCESARPARYRL